MTTKPKSAKPPKLDTAAVKPAATTTTTPPEVINKSRHLMVALKPGKTEDRQFADLVTDGLTVNASTAIRFAAYEHSDLSLTEMVASLEENGQGVNRGDLAPLEKMLNAQAVALNVMFAEMARRSALNMGTHLEATETYMRLALRAQNQSRATVESLSAIKNPPVVFAKQANINNGGQQQVNNGTPGRLPPAHTAENETSPNKLQENLYVEGMDAGAPGAAIGTNQGSQAVGIVNRPKNGGRPSRRVA